VGEHDERLSRTRRTSRGALNIFTIWLGPEENPAGVIYGTITVGAVLAAEGDRAEHVSTAVFTSFMVLLLYWVVHAWSDDTGRRIEKRADLSWDRFAGYLQRDWAIVRGALLPIIAVVIAALLGDSGEQAVYVGTIVSAASLAAIELVTGIRNQLGARQVLVQTLVGAGFGAVLIGLRYLLI
jgi:hypothetical protein